MAQIKNKTQVAINTVIRKNFDIEIKGVDKDNKTLEAVFSTQGEDRHGDVVIQEGFDLKNFKKNPVILNSHNHFDAKAVIGKVESGTLKIDGKKLVGKIKFAVNENPDAKIIFDLYAGGYLNAFSVGFIVKEFDAKDFSKITKAELIEISAVSVPANAAALAKQKGIDVDKLYETKNSESDADEGTDGGDGEQEDIEVEEPNGEVEAEGDSGNTERSEDGETKAGGVDDGVQEPEGEGESLPSETETEGEPTEEIKQLRADIESLKGIIEKLTGHKQDVAIAVTKTKEDRLKDIINKYKKDKISSLAKISEAVAVVSNHYKGRNSSSKTDNNYLINQAVKELLKLKD